MSGPILDRRMLSVDRAADFIDKRALVSQTGRPPEEFGQAVIKELTGNGLDAAETAGVRPEITVTITTGSDTQLITVTDNGGGIRPEDVDRILDFTTTTSDKALYRSPTRGLMGNATKTIVGIPRALGLDDPVIIEAHGKRHLVAVSLDMAGNLRVRHDTEDVPVTAGTSVTVPVPARLDGDALELDAFTWVTRYAFVNPHAIFTYVEQAHDSEPEDPLIYKPTAGDDWRKPVPGDPTSPWWYDTAAFTRLAGSLAAIGDDRPIGEFTSEFAGLRGSAKRKEVAAAIPGIRRVSDLADNPDAAAAMLTAMKRLTTPPDYKTLGQIPAGHYRELIGDLYGIEGDRYWYKHGGLVHNGIAWHIEVAIAATLGHGDLIYGINYDAAYGDPLGRAELRTADVYNRGARGFLAQCDAVADYGNGHRRAAVVHVTTTAPMFYDKDKTALDVPEAVADEFARVLWAAGKELHKEKRAAERAGNAAARAARKTPAKSMSQKDGVTAVIPEAIRLQRGGTDLPFSSHSLFYKIRPLYLKLVPDGTLTSSYCEQTLIPAYEREHGPIPGMYREPRGELHEPHDPEGRRVVRLGTREVEEYRRPEWLYDKLLVVEKAGLLPVLKASRISDRYDMGLISSEGFSATAPRDLLARLRTGNVKIFALHDADHSGYVIARTLAEATVRMPGHNIEVIDLGLTVDDAIGLGLDPEPYTRECDLPARIKPHLTSAARDWFTGVPNGWDHYGRPKSWKCKRAELNALSSPGLIAYIERELERHGATAKVVPPPQVIEAEARDAHHSEITREVADIIAELTDTDAITRAIIAESGEGTDFAITPETVRERLDLDRVISWRAAVADETSGRRHLTGADVRQRVTAALMAVLADPEGGVS